MLGLLWLIPAIPFASALALAVLRVPRKLVTWIAVGATARLSGGFAAGGHRFSERSARRQRLYAGPLDMV